MALTEDMNLKGMVALVTGGALRIGRELCLALAKRGASVAVHYGSSTYAAAETVASIRAIGGQAESYQADLRNVPDVVRMVRDAGDRFGHLDILVNSAAVYRTAEIFETTESLWDEHFAVNLKAPFFLAQAFASHLGGERRGQIVNIADWRGARPDNRCPVYSMTKSGILAMTETLALALAPHVRVNAIAPGAVLPPPGKDDEYLEDVARKYPLGRGGAPGELADALLYLVTAETVTGQVLYVDGGQHLAGSRG